MSVEDTNNDATVSSQQFGNDGEFTISSTNTAGGTEVLVAISGYGDDSAIFTNDDLVSEGIIA
jgi:hypothetical protein